MRKLFRYLAPYKLPIVFIFALVFIQSLSELFLPTLMSDIIDKGVINQNIPYIWKIGGFMLLVAAVGTLCSITASYFSAKVSMSFGKNLRSRVFSHVENFSLHEFEQVGTASLITRTTNDITQVQLVLNMILRMMIMAPLMAIGGIIMAFSKDPELSWVIILAIPVLVGVILFVIWKGVPLFKLVQRRLDAVNRVIRENLTGVRVIRSFNRINFEKERFKKANKDLRDTTIKVNKLMATLMPLMMLIMNYTTIAVVWFGAIRIDHGDMQVGDLMAFIQYAMQIMFSMVMLSMMFVMIPRASASAARINEVLAIKPTIKDEPIKHEAKPTKTGYLEFKNVTFSYPGAEEPALKGLSFSAGPGEVTAIIGGTGSGKSTLLKLIPRFYEPTEGSIYLNGINIKELELVDLRNRIGLVPQKAVLFTGTVKENILYGNENASDEEVIHAAKVAQAYDFVSNMKEGFDSPISQGGTNISGGQKQRLSIARALVRKPEIYMFDDSFSALDFKTDAKLRKALKSETTEGTVLLVAQRVSTVMDADRIIVLDEGNVMGIGTHEELLKSCETYQEIVKSQLSEEEIA
ncbi:ABC transporter ATP-binding protein [Pradoshia sp. D12]|uniref:ABC transporter ATP-binding protein n=1 Tax=Bacillaceae TaxID=186817 RepID=UPI001127543B|nr:MULTISPECIES: ABC transporter ATP-binding protein [Bacillaceae]QFK71108.1 ABC transporter ATP-binding protein [Pradoshia sp. D12]TPF72900.1 ABC transporter ATP-binding protein [Bacillus sp. D12]